MVLFVLVVAGAVSILGEILYAHVTGRRLYSKSDTFSNLSAAAFEHVFTVLIAGLVYSLYAEVYRFRLVEHLALAPAVALGVVLMDLGFYVWHRASHRVSLLWFGHAVHHSSEEFNFSVAVRSSGWVRYTQRFFYLPMALAGIPVEAALLADAFTNLYALLLHNRVVGKLGVLEYVLVTPSHHRVHHARNPEYLDKNFGSVLILWDRLFGTFAEEIAPPVYGLRTPLRTHNVVWARFHVLFEIGERIRRTPGLWQKLWVPFRPPEWDPAGDHDTTGAAAPQCSLVPAAPRTMRLYAFAQHVVLFGAALAFTFVAERLSPALRITAALWLCGSLGIVGALLDARRWAMRAEAARWALAAGGAALYFA